MIEFILKDIADVYIRENFVRLTRFLNGTVFFNQNFKVFNVEIPSASASFPVAHGFTFVPEDIVITNVEGDFNFYFRYQEFDRSNLYITADGPVRIKFLVGRFDNNINKPAGEKYPLVPPS